MKTGLDVLNDAFEKAYVKLPDGRSIDDLPMERYQQAVEAMQMKSSFALHTASGWVAGNAGDWLVVDKDSRISVVSNREFKRRFERVT